MNKPSQEELVSAGTAAATTAAQIARLTAAVTEAVGALTAAVDVLTAKAQELAGHSRVMATEAHAGHFKPGMGFEYNAENGTHNVNGTVDFANALNDALSPLQQTLGSLTWRGSRQPQSTTE